MTFLKIVFPNIGGSLNFKRNFADFPPKLYQLVAESILICNEKLKWVLMYLIFLHIMNKFLNDMMCFERPTTSIIAFGVKSAKCLKFKEAPMLGSTISKNVTDRLNGH